MPTRPCDAGFGPAVASLAIGVMPVRAPRPLDGSPTRSPTSTGTACSSPASSPRTISSFTPILIRPSPSTRSRSSPAKPASTATPSPPATPSNPCRRSSGKATRSSRSNSRSNTETPSRKLLAELPEAVFPADDSLGWTYQYWQADQKDAVNESGDKIGADEISAVTQLFTEHYMVLFLYHNTIGAWRAGRILAANPVARRDRDQPSRNSATPSGSKAAVATTSSTSASSAPKWRATRQATPTGPWRPGRRHLRRLAAGRQGPHDPRSLAAGVATS